MSVEDIARVLRDPPQSLVYTVHDVPAKPAWQLLREGWQPEGLARHLLAGLRGLGFREGVLYAGAPATQVVESIGERIEKLLASGPASWDWQGRRW